MGRGGILGISLPNVLPEFVDIDGSWVRLGRGGMIGIDCVAMLGNREYDYE
jgi:hypothetical protein